MKPENAGQEKIRFDHYGPMHEAAGVYLLWFKRGTENLLAGVLVAELQDRIGIADLSQAEIECCCDASMSRLEYQVQHLYEQSGGQPGDMLLQL